VLFNVQSGAQTSFSINWAQPVLINNMPVFKDAGKVKDAVDFYRQQGTYGSSMHAWLNCITVHGLRVTPFQEITGTVKLQKEVLNCRYHSSTDHGRHWNSIAIISDPGRDLDNTQMIQLSDGVDPACLPFCSAGRSRIFCVYIKV
jgi:hypothetical protein